MDSKIPKKGDSVKCVKSLKISGNSHVKAVSKVVPSNLEKGTIGSIISSDKDWFSASFDWYSSGDLQLKIAKFVWGNYFSKK